MNVLSRLRAKFHGFIGAAVILLAASIAVAPQIMRGNSCGHDFDFHLVSWFDTIHSWREGVLYPHWTPSPNYGAGEPRFIFYPPLTWMLGALLGTILPWGVVPIALTWLLLSATGLATRALARHVLDDGAATLAGCVALFSGYALFTAYERSAFAELTGGFWIPLLLLLALRDHNARPSTTESASIWRRSFNGSTVPLAFVIAGSWLSNAPLGVMACYLLAAIAAVSGVLSRSWAPVLHASTSAVLGMGLTAFYLLPAAWEQRWVDIRQATDDPGLLVQNSWLFARHANPLLKLHDIELFKVSVIVVVMIALTLIAFLIIWRRGMLSAHRDIWLPLALIPVLILLLQFPISLPIWMALPKLRFLQFPWRWLVVLEGPMGIFVAAAIWTKTRTSRLTLTALCCLAFVTSTGVASHFYFQACYPEDAVPAMLADYNQGTGFEGTDEYEPPGADDSLVATKLPGACLVADPTATLGIGDPDSTPEWSPDQGSCAATFPLTSDKRKPRSEHLHLQAVIPHDGYLVLRLRTYPAWRVVVNGQSPAAMPAREDGLMAVPVTTGPLNLTVDWTTTRDVLIGRWGSLLALVLVTGLWLFERNTVRARLS